VTDVPALPRDGQTVPPGEIHLWSAPLDLSEAGVRALSGILAADEGRRADRFVFPRDRARFVAGRGFLRHLLGAYLGEEPGGVRLEQGPSGKPALAAGHRDLRFNLSHADGLAVCALVEGEDVGADVERLRPLADALQIAQSFFSPSENEDLRGLPEPDRLRAFWDCWTRKEAFLKATGEGLGRPLDSFDVTLRPGEPARLRRLQEDPHGHAGWSLLTVVPEPGFVAAVALRGSEWRLRPARAWWDEETRAGAGIAIRGPERP
jgi:4'-phosphopantetheinyl transferase